MIWIKFLLLLEIFVKVSKFIKKIISPLYVLCIFIFIFRLRQPLMFLEMWFSLFCHLVIMVVVESHPISLLVRANPLTKLQLRTSLPTNLRVVGVGESHPTNLQEELNLQMEEVGEVSSSH